MKNKVKILALLFGISVASSACKKEDNHSSSSASTYISAAGRGNWQVTLLNDNGTDETNHFSGYSFRFNNGGLAVATNNTNSVNGTWSSGQDDDHVEFSISFPSAPLNELNNDWHIVKQTPTTMELEDVSGGGGGTHYLNLQKL